MLFAIECDDQCRRTQIALLNLAENVHRRQARCRGAADVPVWVETGPTLPRQSQAPITGICLRSEPMPFGFTVEEILGKTAAIVIACAQREPLISFVTTPLLVVIVEAPLLPGTSAHQANLPVDAAICNPQSAQWQGLRQQIAKHNLGDGHPARWQSFARFGRCADSLRHRPLPDATAHRSALQPLC